MTEQHRADIIGLPVREQEKYVTRVELAAIMRVSVSQVDKWKQQGMPHESWGLRVTRFLPSRAMAWVRTQRHEEAA